MSQLFSHKKQKKQIFIQKCQKVVIFTEVLIAMAQKILYKIRLLSVKY